MSKKTNVKKPAGLAAATGYASAMICQLTPDTAREMVANTKLPMKLGVWGTDDKAGEITKLRVDKQGNVYATMKLNAVGKAELKRHNMPMSGSARTSTKL